MTTDALLTPDEIFEAPDFLGPKEQNSTTKTLAFTYAQTLWFQTQNLYPL